MTNMLNLGWCDFFASQLDPDSGHDFVARISGEHRTQFEIFTDRGPRLAKLGGKLRFECENLRQSLPAVGDFVLCRGNADDEVVTLLSVFERRTAFIRKMAGRKNAPQVIASNVDFVFCVSALSSDINLARMERYLALIFSSGAAPVIVLTKPDLCASVDVATKAVATRFPNVAWHVVNAVSGEGTEALTTYLSSGNSVALVGTSGVGKSTLTNRMLGREALETQATRDWDDKGRHTTTHRQMFELPQGGVIIDTPGMRELGIYDADVSFVSVFDKLEALAKQCKFRDCRHESEPGCAILQAIDNGEVDRSEFKSYLKLQREAAYQSHRESPTHFSEQREKWKRRAREVRAHQKSARRNLE